MVKCLSTFSCSSTTQLLRAFLWACLWKIFSSMVPVYDYEKNTTSSFLANIYLFKVLTEALEKGVKQVQS